MELIRLLIFSITDTVRIELPGEMEIGPYPTLYRVQTNSKIIVLTNTRLKVILLENSSRHANFI